MLSKRILTVDGWISSKLYRKVIPIRNVYAYKNIFTIFSKLA